MSQYIAANQATQRSFYNQLKKYYGFYTVGFLAFIIALAVANRWGFEEMDRLLVPLAHRPGTRHRLHDRPVAANTTRGPAVPRSSRHCDPRRLDERSSFIGMACPTSPASRLAW